MSEEKRVIEVKEVFNDASIYGYLGGKQEYTPFVFEEMKVPKEKQFSVNIEPMSDEDCTSINSLNKEESLRLSLWFGSEDGSKALEANSKLKQFDGDQSQFTDDDFKLVQSIVKKREELSTNAQKFSIVKKYISDLSKPHPLSKKGRITDKAWSVLPIKIKADIYNAIYDISILGESDAINLQ